LVIIQISRYNSENPEQLHARNSAVTTIVHSSGRTGKSLTTYYIRADYKIKSCRIKKEICRYICNEIGSHRKKSYTIS
jgi:hypothetical protein